jgi:hypothetical protein
MSNFIEELLASYNDNVVLYRLFGDLCYKERTDYFSSLLDRHFILGNEAKTNQLVSTSNQNV